MGWLSIYHGCRRGFYPLWFLRPVEVIPVAHSDSSPEDFADCPHHIGIGSFNRHRKPWHSGQRLPRLSANETCLFLWQTGQITVVSSISNHPQQLSAPDMIILGLVLPAGNPPDERVGSYGNTAPLVVAEQGKSCPPPTPPHKNLDQRDWPHQITRSIRAHSIW